MIRSPLAKIAVFVVGVLVLAGGIYFFLDTQNFIKSAARADGVVVDLEQDNGEDGTVYYPVIQFEDNNGHTTEFKSSVGSSPPSYQVNQHVNVYYNPLKPSDYRFDDFFALWLLPIILGVVGVIMLVSGVAFFLRR